MKKEEENDEKWKLWREGKLGVGITRDGNPMCIHSALVKSKVETLAN